MTSLKTLCTALLLSAAASTFASSTDLTITGIITPAACQPYLSSGSIVDFGEIPARTLNSTTPTILPTRGLQLAVMCDGPTTYALQIKDHHQDSSPDPQVFFGLGKTPDGENIGDYLMTLDNAFADGKPTRKIHSLDDGKTWIEAGALPVPPLHLAAFGDQSSGAWSPILIKQLLVDLRVRPLINPTRDLTLTQEVPLTGKATVELRYL
ncbi:MULTISPECIES: DUF1120 domain-containing protein [unclassified Pseudomonas]|uniref:DUF1120 domain-containing protein n=1 Tax=Pseudomonas sp. MYb327 TaxID=2745230 RepID=A0AAU8E3J8_9PSED